MSFVLNVWLLRQIVNGFQAGVNMLSLLLLVLTVNGAMVVYNIIYEAYYQIRYPVLRSKSASINKR